MNTELKDEMKDVLSDYLEVVELSFKESYLQITDKDSLMFCYDILQTYNRIEKIINRIND